MTQDTVVTDPSKWVLFTALLLIGFGYLSINLPLSVFPDLLSVFHRSQATLQLSMSVFLYGYAAAQLFWGALADAFGSKKILLYSTSIAIIGTGVTLAAPNYATFFSGRLIEAIGIGAAATMARAILGDWQSGKTLGISLIYLICVSSLMPGVAPFLGSTLLALTGSWRSIFLFLALVGVVTLLSIGWHYQNKPNMIFKPATIAGIFQRYKIVLTTPNFFAYFLSYGLLLGLLINFYTIAPYIFVNALQLTHHEYSAMVLIVGICYFCSALMTRLMISLFAMRTIFIFGIILCLLSAALFLASALLLDFSALTIVLPMSIFAVGCGFISPSSNALALSVVEEKGSASALMASIVMAMAGCFSWLMVKLPLNHLMSYAWVFGISALICLILEVCKKGQAA